MPFTELNAELEGLLRELQDARASGQPVEDFIAGKLREAPGRAAPGEAADARELHEAYMELVDLGYLRWDRPSLPFSVANRANAEPSFGGLTSNGRKYFEMKRAHRRRKRAERLGTILVTAVLTTAAGAFGSQCATLQHEQAQSQATACREVYQPADAPADHGSEHEGDDVSGVGP